jgi:ribose-phosphate pyrophosphokinase
LTNAAKALKERGARDVYACCTHAVLSGSAPKRIGDSALSELLVTDTIDCTRKPLPANIKVLTVADLLAEAIARISNEESLTTLFTDFS